MTERKSTALEGLKGLIHKELDKLSKGQFKRIVDIQGIWQDAVGPQLSLQCKILKFERGTLSVGVKSSTWMNELVLMKPELLSKINAHQSLTQPVTALQFRLLA